MSAPVMDSPAAGDSALLLARVAALEAELKLAREAAGEGRREKGEGVPLEAVVLKEAGRADGKAEPAPYSAWQTTCAVAYGLLNFVLPPVASGMMIMAKYYPDGYAARFLDYVEVGDSATAEERTAAEMRNDPDTAEPLDDEDAEVESPPDVRPTVSVTEA